MHTLDIAMHWFHVAAGVLMLITMVIPMVTKKGGRVHRRAGWVFVVCMAILCLSSAWMCIVALLGQAGVSVTGRGTMSRAFGAFLLVVTLISGHAVFSGVRVLRYKKRTAPVRNALDLGFAALLGLSGLGLFIWGLSEVNILLLAFGVLAMLLSIGELRMLRSVPTDKRYWWYAHMTGMFNGCVAAITAFSVINSEHLPQAVHAVVPEWVFWVVPGMIGTPILVVWQKRYQRQFSHKAKA